MGFEQEFNMLNKRAHLEDALTASQDFFGVVEFGPGEQGLRHQYSCWCYNYFEGSQGHYFFPDGDILMEPEKGFLIPPYTPHYLRNPGTEPMQMVYMGIGFNTGMGATGPYTREEILEVNRRWQENYYNKSFHEKFHGLFRQLKTVGFHGSEEILKGYRMMALENLIRVHEFVSGEETAPVSDADAILLQDIKNIITHNLSRNISLQEISQALFVSPRKLTGKFLELTGMSFKEYTQMLKMEHASRLLYSSNMSISEIAEELGFCDIHYFSRRFKMYYGCPPNALRGKKKST